MKNILIVEDYQIIRLATKILVQDLYKTAVVREATTFDEALSELAVHLRISLSWMFRFLRAKDLK